jgi:lipopolysaccharide export system permease protein
MAQRLDTGTDRLATANFRDFSFDISALVQSEASLRPDPERMTTLALMTPWDRLSEQTGDSIGSITQTFHKRFADPLFCVIAALIGFSTLMLGGFSRFGVWREVAIAFGLLVVIDGARSTLQGPVRSDPGLWPMLYAPAALSLLLVLILLWAAARPKGRRKRRLQGEPA